MRISEIIRTARRDIRMERPKLFLFMSSIILGVAALVAINAFNYNITADVNRQAKDLLGADLVFESNKPISKEVEGRIDSIPGEEATMVELLSMAYLPATNESQFVNIRAINGGFPFYGELVTEPAEAEQSFRQSRSALVDAGLMLQYELAAGDTIRLGRQPFVIAGALVRGFGDVEIGSGFAPPVVIAGNYIAETELIQPGSLVDYFYYKKTPESFDPELWRKNFEQDFRDLSVRVETVEEQKEDLEEAFSSLNKFLNLIALVSLLLACIGVASSVLIYVKGKVNTIAILRVMGMEGREAFSVFFLQIVAISLLSVIAGAALGSFIQWYLPVVFAAFLPFEVSTAISWMAIIQGIGIGLVLTLLFALIPLVRIRNISPLQTLRSSLEQEAAGETRLTVILYAGIVLTLWALLWIMTGSWKDAFIFTGGLAASFGLLFLFSSGVIWLVRRYFPRKWSFLFRQGLSNLFRPNNQTQLLLISIGLGTAILTTLFIVQGLILDNVQEMGAGNQPNMILFGMETRQKDEVNRITESYGMPILEQTPIVTMQLHGWKGRTKEAWLADSTRTAERWAINRESRVSFTDVLPKNDKLLRGTFMDRVGPGDSIFISLAESFASAMDVDLGDEMIWNVQGALITTYVGSIREINFRRLETRFFVLFPPGVLEEAPQFHVLVTKSPDKETTASYRSDIVRNFPNVSVIDLESILVTLNEILAKVSYAIQFMAVFSILTGLIVLISSLFLSRFQRMNESVLMRTLGASKRQIYLINFIEYILLGVLASVSGILIALLSSLLLMKYVFEFNFFIPWVQIGIVLLAVPLLTAFIGWLNSGSILDKSPLEVLRKEVN